MKKPGKVFLTGSGVSGLLLFGAFLVLDEAHGGVVVGGSHAV